MGTATAKGVIHSSALLTSHIWTPHPARHTLPAAALEFQLRLSYLLCSELDFSHVCVNDYLNKRTCGIFS